MLGLLGVWRVLLTPGTLGHHWDWSIPPSSSFSQQVLRQSSQAWSQQSLGYSYVTAISIFPTLTILGFLSSIGLSGDAISKGLVILVIATSGFSAYLLLLEVTGPIFKGVHSAHVYDGGSFLGGYFYALSPFLFNELVGGAYTQFVAYSLAPLAVWAFIRSFSSQRAWARSLIAAIILSSIAMSLQYLVIVLVVIFVIAVVNAKKGATSFVRVSLLWLPLNFYWIVPLLSTLQGTLGSSSSQNPLSSILLNLQIHTPTVLQAFVGTGYFTDFFSATLPSSVYPTWIMIPITLVATSLTYISVKLRTRDSFVWIGILLSSIVLETGYNSPLAGFVVWLFASLPPMILFKSPQHLIFPAILALAVAVGIASSGFLNTRFRRRRFAVFVILVLTVSFWVSPMFSGNFGGAVDVYRLPTSYSKIDHILSADNNSSFRVLYMPMAGSPLYLPDGYQSKNQGGDPTVIYSVAPTILSDLSPNPVAKQFAGEMETMLAENPPPNAVKLLCFVNVKYIVLRSDVVPNFGPLVGDWNYTQVFQNLSNLSGLRLIAQYPEASLWQNEFARSPQIYAANNVIYDDPPVSGVRNWQELSGEWTTYQQYSVRGSNGVLRSDSTYTDSNFTAQTKLLGNHSYDNWVVWRGFDDENYYYAGQTGIGYFGIGRVIAGVRTEMSSKWMGYTLNQSIWVRVISHGDNFQIFSGSDGKSWTYMSTFEDVTLNSGFVGFRSNGVGQFTNATAWDLSGDLIFADDFSRSNLFQIILSSGFVVGQTAIISPNSTMQTRIDTSALATAISNSRTQYVIQINARGPFYLVDGEAFDDGWILELPGVTHIVANGLMNAWIVGYGTYEKAALIYGPQRLFQYGTLISLASLGSFVILIIVQKRLSTTLNLLRIRLRRSEA